MQGQGSTGHQKMDEEDNKYYLEAPDTPNTQPGRFAGDQAAGADWQGNTDSAAGFGRRKNSGSDYGGQGQGRGRDGPGQWAIGVNRRSRSRSQSKERNSARLQDNQDDGDKTVEDDRRFMYVVRMGFDSSVLQEVQDFQQNRQNLCLCGSKKPKKSPAACGRWLQNLRLQGLYQRGP